ncbi:MAG TPA: RimK/LysX family protein [Nitrosomonas halophila]|nr:RimK/LysX family protein [Nitrosomonas halophila]
MHHYLLALSLMGIVTSVSAEPGNPSSEISPDSFSIYGHVEKVALIPDDVKAIGDIEIPALLDTGAAKSSLHAKDIEVIETGDQKLVRFIFDDHNGSEYPMTLPLIKKVAIKQASGKQIRYVVEMGICVGDHYKKNLFTLTDRSRMTYPVLVGRNFLKNTVLVSSKHKMTSVPNCMVDG